MVLCVAVALFFLLCCVVLCCVVVSFCFCFFVSVPQGGGWTGGLTELTEKTFVELGSRIIRSSDPLTE